jgi:hypothetical protein
MPREPAISLKFLGLPIYLACLSLWFLPSKEELRRSLQPMDVLHELQLLYPTPLPHADWGNVSDTTAVVLNWSRLPNVILITTLLCLPSLEQTISNIVIWNNNPNVILAEKVVYVPYSMPRS